MVIGFQCSSVVGKAFEFKLGSVSLLLSRTAVAEAREQFGNPEEGDGPPLESGTR
jgi:hypothetical protein